MAEPRRVTPQKIYPKVQSGETLLVCAYDDEATTAGQAAKFIEQGYSRAAVLKGGIDGWRQAGYPMAAEA